MHDDDLSVLFTRAADALDPPMRTDVTALVANARRARRRRRSRRAVGAALAAIIVGVVAVPRILDPDAPAEVETGPADARPGEWTRLPDPPLAPRTGASAAWTGEEVVVVGGSTFLCPPSADCSGPDEPPFADGAAFDPTTSTWRSIADAPVPFSNLNAVVVEDDVYLLVPCANAGCAEDAEYELLRYDGASDTWAELPGPPNDRGYALAPAGPQLIAYASTDEQGEVPDWRFDPDDTTWSEIPDDPLPLVFDRQVVLSDVGLLLFGAAIDPTAETDGTVLGAGLEPTPGASWSDLPPSPSRGYRAWAVDAFIVLEPHFGGEGGLFRPNIDVWSSLPPAPDDPSWPNGVSGAYGARTAAYGGSSGWVADIVDMRWVKVPPIDDRDTFPDTSVATVGRDLFVFGGARWSGAPEGELLGDAWLWHPPDPPPGEAP